MHTKKINNLNSLEILYYDKLKASKKYDSKSYLEII